WHPAKRPTSQLQGNERTDSYDHLQKCRPQNSSSRRHYAVAAAASDHTRSDEPQPRCRSHLHEMENRSDPFHSSGNTAAAWRSRAKYYSHGGLYRRRCPRHFAGEVLYRKVSANGRI